MQLRVAHGWQRVFFFPSVFKVILPCFGVGILGSEVTKSQKLREPVLLHSQLNFSVHVGLSAWWDDIIQISQDELLYAQCV